MKRNSYFMMLLIIVIGIILFFYFFDADEKFYCETNNDCIMSYNDKEDFQICVNNDWHNKNPSNIVYQCKPNNSLSCLCKSNHCVRIDYEKGCD